MMLGEEQFVASNLFVKLLQLLAQQALLKQLFLQPQRDRHLERRKPSRRHRDIGLEQPFEFQERLVVEGDAIDIGELCARGLKAIADRVLRKRRVMFLAREALLLSGRDDKAVLDQRGGAVVIERGDAEDAHSSQKSV